MNTILEGETLAVHTALCGELEGMLGKDGDRPDDSKTLAVVRQAEDWGFARYRQERALDLGHVMSLRKTQWELERVNTYPLSGSEAWDMLPTRDGGIAVGYYGGGLEMFTVDGPVKKILEDVRVQRISTLSDGRYIVRDSSTMLAMYTKDWEREFVIFSTAGGNYGGLCVDNHYNIYVGNHTGQRIAVFRPEGGVPIKQITSPGLSPQNIQHMNHSNMLVVTDAYTVKVIDEEGTVKHDVSKDDYTASIAVLQDDSIADSLEEGWSPYHRSLHTTAEVRQGRY